jgi:hypothetical protein
MIVHLMATIIAFVRISPHVLELKMGLYGLAVAQIRSLQTVILVTRAAAAAAAVVVIVIAMKNPLVHQPHPPV